MFARIRALFFDLNHLWIVAQTLWFLMAVPVQTQASEAPGVVTLCAVKVTQASATFRAEVNPNGAPTVVEFFCRDVLQEHDNGSNPTSVSVGKVEVPASLSPTVVELRATGLNTGWFTPAVWAQARNPGGSSRGGDVKFTLQRLEGNPYNEWEPFNIAFYPVRNITERGFEMDVEIVPRRWTTSILLQPAFKMRDGAFHFKNDVEQLIRWQGSDSPVRLHFKVDGLYSGMEYELFVMLGTPTAADGNQAMFVVRTFGTLGVPGHNPPEFPSLSVRVPIGSASSVTRLVKPFDPDDDSVVIESVSNPLHGTTAVAAMEWIYTPDGTYGGADQFSVTVVDSKGERATRLVQIYDVRARTYDFDLPLNWSMSDPPRPAGRLRLNTTIAGAFTGKASIYNEDYPVRGAFDGAGEALVELDRKGLPPLVSILKLLPGVDGEMHLSAAISAAELSAPYVAEGLPLGNAETSEGPAGESYTAVLPNNDGAPESSAVIARTARVNVSDTPQGDGFLVGHVNRVGRLRFTGRTGDGQAFALGGRLQRNRHFEVSSSVGKQPRDYIVGDLEFSRDSPKTLQGSIGWLSFRSPSEYYSQDFTRVAVARGAAYRKPRAGTNVFGELGVSSAVHVSLFDGKGVGIIDSDILVGAKEHASAAGSYRLEFSLDPKAGLFRGTVGGPGLPRSSRFMGILVQPLQRGGGQLLLNGPVGSVRVTAPTL